MPHQGCVMRSVLLLINRRYCSVWEKIQFKRREVYYNDAVWIYYHVSSCVIGENVWMIVFELQQLIVGALQIYHSQAQLR